MSQSPLPATLSQLESAYRVAPSSRLFAPLADAYRQAGRLQEALEILQRGTQNHPDYVSAWVLLGLCQREVSGSQAAEITFARVLTLDPENLVALKHRARRALEGNDAATAAALVERVLEIDPYDQEALGLRDDVTSLQESQPLEEVGPVSTLPPPTVPPTVEASSPGDRGAAAEEPPILDLQDIGTEENAGTAPAPETGEDRERHTQWQVQRDADRIVIRPRGAQAPAAGSSQTDEFSTMTLARIYESQGYDDKALAIYEALLQRDPDDRELQERVQALRQRLGAGSAPAPPAERRWRLLDAEKLGAEAEQTAEGLRRLAGRVRDQEEDKHHTVIGRAPSAPPPPAPAPDTVRSDEPDFERFLRYVRSLKR